MADINLKSKLSFSKDGQLVNTATETFTQATMAGGEMIASTQVLADGTYVAIETGDVTITSSNNYWVRLMNLQTTAGQIIYVSWDGTNDQCMMDAGECCGPFKVKGGVTVRIKGAAGYRCEVVAGEV